MKGQKPSKVKTGIIGLDDVLRGGFPPRRLYLVQGAPGSGKTTLALQFLLEGARSGENVLYISLSETREEIEEVAASHGWSLEGLEIIELSAIDEQLSAESQNTLFHTAEVELTETTRMLLDAVDRVKPTRLAFDSLSELRLPSQSALRYRRQILSFKQYLAGRNCTTLLLDDTSAGGSDSHVQSLAHGVISLDQTAPDYGAERRRFLVRKIRGTTYRGGYHDFIIETGGLEFYPRLVAAEHHRPFPNEMFPVASRESTNFSGAAWPGVRAVSLSARPVRASPPWRCISPSPRPSAASELRFLVSTKAWKRCERGRKA